MLADTPSRVRTAPWLKSDYSANTWRCEFGRSGSFNLQFDIRLTDGSKLLDGDILPDLIKAWLVTSTSWHCSRRESATPGTHYGIVNAVLTWVDYFLLNDHLFGFSEYGLEGLTRDSFLGAMAAISRDRHKAIAVYDWERRVIDFARTGAQYMNNVEIERIVAMHPSLGKVDESTLKPYPNLTAREVVTLRAWLQANGHLVRSGEHRFSLNSPLLSKHLYANTLRGVNSAKPGIEIFTIERYGFRGKRAESIPTTRKGDGITGISLSKPQYCRSFQALHTLHDALPPINGLPSAAVISLATEDASVNLSPGRFRTVPAPVVFKAIKCSVEFILNFGDAIAGSFERLLASSQKLGINVEDLPSDEFSRCLDSKLKSLNVTSWRVSTRKRNSKQQFLPVVGTGEATGDDLRGMGQCIRVLYGAAFVIIGALMARRQGELTELDAATALDVSEKYMLFWREKSGQNIYGARDLEVRPIASIAARAVKQLRAVQEALVGHGFIPKLGMLVQMPSAFSATTLLSAANHKTLTTALDAFCDYADLHAEDGRRYYLREHQLRRFFCMMFFWHTSFAGLDTLRWFLGHSNLAHVYRYITESVPGNVLASVKAQHLAETLVAHENLTAFLQHRFGISRFALLTTEELEEHIAVLIEEGTVSVEPEFFEGPDGSDYRILVTVR